MPSSERSVSSSYILYCTIPGADDLLASPNLPLALLCDGRGKNSRWDQN